MVSRLREDYDGIENFRRANSENRNLKITRADAVMHPEACLCPALCYHCYPTLAGQRLKPAGHVETAVGRICRYESSNITGLDRLWEFTQRSIIWVGADQFCTDLRQRAIDAATAQLEEWDIEATIETASRSVFRFRHHRQDAVATLAGAQIRTETGDRADRHRAAPDQRRGLLQSAWAPYFGHAFDIQAADGEPAAAVALSWGLERWVLVVFTQHGFDPRNWPAALRL
jgi:hypothetical protein